MKTLRFVPLAASLVALALATNAHAVAPAPAFNYAIEQFQIDKKIGGTWTTIFLDTFSSATNAAAPGLTAPVAGTSYGIRLTDKTTADPLGNDSLSLIVRNSGSGTEIAFTKADFLTPSSVTVDSDTLPLNSPYIALRLTHNDPTNQVVTASFAYLSSVGDLGTATWNTSFLAAAIFSDENFTRAEFRASAAPVPEADTWAMMAVGVGLIGLQLRRRSASSGSVLG